MASRRENLQNPQKYEINCMGEPTVSLSDAKVSSNRRSIILHQHQQQVIPEEISPYVTSHTLSNRLYALKYPANCNTGLIGEKIMSTKIIKMKELESELNLRRSQLNEVIAENRVLKALQRRQELALKNYEQSKGQLPQLIQSHSEEIKVLKTKCKKMSAQNRDLEKKLREREAELQTLQDQHKHLLKLSKDRNLGERERLQEEVTYLKQMMESMEAQVQDLSKKRAIEHKVHQQQMQSEISRSKECRKALLCAEKQIHHLEDILKYHTY
ncbi:hypothetical protein J437_LFUL015896 [Ladona fulva]|uniref:Lebercilin domain-containing protein n=1 Tax=Ladona fulva TaxID=123851 RepID=A0A8K0KJ22_LADFU|nr:hypothetical protein J437_LFUL015896 [Ladona fulva]